MRRWRDRATRAPRPGIHHPRREGDEMACPCGMRWPVGEDHPPLADQSNKG